ncbi:starch synthase, partial [Cymbomonas tetramitiformis]
MYRCQSIASPKYVIGGSTAKVTARRAIARNIQHLSKRAAIPAGSLPNRRSLKTISALSDDVLAVEDPDEIEKQILALKEENDRLQARLSVVKSKASEEPVPAAAPEGTKKIKDLNHPKIHDQGQEGTSTPAATAATSASGPDKATDLSRADILFRKWQHKEPPKVSSDPLAVVFVTSEVAPWSKTGGLGDVAGALPQALAQRGHRTMVIAPRYQTGKNDELYDAATATGHRIEVWLFGETVSVELYSLYQDGVDYVFVDHPAYRRPGNPYGDENGAYGDNLFRFVLLSLVACEIPLQMELGGYTYGDKCVFVANDWHASLVCVYVAAKYRPHGVYNNARTILAIHNLAHHGTAESSEFPDLGLPNEWYGALEWVFPEHMRQHELDKGEAINPLKGAIVSCDRLLTVSQGYAYEITTPEGGFLLEGLLGSRAHVLNGITNGVDLDEWNPATDKHIPAHYWPGHMDGKAECKKALQKELGLREDPNVPLIGFIGRLDYQKGPDLIQESLDGIMYNDVQLIMLGSGDPAIEEWMGWAEATYSDKFRGWRGFSVPVAHRITAGCDILLMPSRFEPCGLNQLYAM